MRLFALTVGKNESGRYIIPMLRYAQDYVDGHFFYDDQSEDDTPEVAQLLHCKVKTRPDEVPSFVENEGAFRGAAWQAFEKDMQPEPGDWVLVIDCDETLVSQTQQGHLTRKVIEKEIRECDRVAINLNIPEVFGFDEFAVPLVRVDRLWATIHAPRLFRWQPNGEYYVGDFGTPAVPTYVMAGQPWGQSEELSLMHYGYAKAADRQAKYARYEGHLGHSNAHVQSIIAADKVLERWPYPYACNMEVAWNRLTLL